MVQASAIILILAVCLVIYFVFMRMYRFYNERRVTSKQYNNLITDKLNAKRSKTVGGKDIPTSSYSNEYAISFWININDYSYKFKQSKVVLMKGSESGEDANPKISLHPYENDLTVEIKLQSEDVNESFANVLEGGEEIDDITTSDPAPVMQDGGEQHILEQQMVKDAFGNISDNSSPSNTNVYNEGFFGNVSGNVVEGFEVVEGFGIMEDMEQLQAGMAEDVANMPLTIEERNRQFVILLGELCKLIQDASSKEASKEVVKLYNLLFDTLLEVIDASSPDNVQEIMMTRLGNPEDVGMETANQFVNKYQNLFKSLIYMQISQSLVNELTDAENRENNKKLVDLVNEKMKSINCEMTFTHSDEEDIEKSLVKQIVTMIKNRGKKLIVNMAKEIDPELIQRDPKLSGYDSCTIRQVPLQKWVHIVVSVYNDVVDMYLDGRLKSSCVLKGFPDVNTKDLHITPDGGFSGSIAKMTYVNGSLNQDEVYAIYKLGPKYRTGLWGSVVDFFKRNF